MSSTTGLNEDELAAANIIKSIKDEAFAAGRAVGYAEGVKACRLQLEIFPTTGPASAEDQERTAQRPLSTPLEDLQFTVRIYNCLKRENFHTIGDLLDTTAEGLADIRNFGTNGAEVVRHKLAELGYTLRAS